MTEDRRQNRRRRIILTGASEGIGRALALALAARGARVALAARDRDAARDAGAGMPRRAGGEARALPTDVTNAAGLRMAGRPKR